jgi:hypothetical protein
VRVGEEQDQHADAAEVRGQERLPCSSAGTHLVTRKVVQVALTKALHAQYAARTPHDSLRDNGGAGLLVMRPCAGSLAAPAA